LDACSSYTADNIALVLMYVHAMPFQPNLLAKRPSSRPYEDKVIAPATSPTGTQSILFTGVQGTSPCRRAGIIHYCKPKNNIINAAEDPGTIQWGPKPLGDSVIAHGNQCLSHVQ
jgi:hypothetical protein